MWKNLSHGITLLLLNKTFKGKIHVQAQLSFHDWENPTLKTYKPSEVLIVTFYNGTEGIKCPLPQTHLCWISGVSNTLVDNSKRKNINYIFVNAWSCGKLSLLRTYFHMFFLTFIPHVMMYYWHSLDHKVHAKLFCLINTVSPPYCLQLSQKFTLSSAFHFDVCLLNSRQWNTHWE